MRAVQLVSYGGSLLLASVLPALANPVPSPGPSHQWARLVAFGDSLTDNGNGSYKLTHGTWPADPAYYNGRFSNGPTWIEDLALDVVHSDQDDTLDQGLIDLAYGGSTVNNTRVQGYTGPNSSVPVPSVLEVVQSFLHSDASAHLDDSLFLVSGGGNDAFFGISSSKDLIAFATGIARDIFFAVHDLQQRGARAFLVPVAPSLEQTPYAQLYASASVRAGLTAFSAAFASALHAEACRFRSANPDTKLYLFDQAPAIPRKPTGGLSDVTTPCLLGAYGEVPRSLCDDPDQHVWWDDYHPTRVTHRAIAREALHAIRSGPKPGSEHEPAFVVQ